MAIVTPYALHLWDLRDDIAVELARGNRGMTLAPDGTAATLTVWLISGFNLDLKLGFPDSIMGALHWPLFIVAVIASVLLLLGTGVSVRSCWRRIARLGSRRPVADLDARAAGADDLAVVAGVHPLRSLPRAGAVCFDGARQRSTRRSGTGGRALAMLRGRATWALVIATIVFQAAAVVAFYAALDWSAEAPPTALTPTDAQARLNESDLKARQLGIGELHGLPLRYWLNVANQTRAFARASGIRDVTVVTGIQDDGARWLDKRRKALNYLLGPDLRPRFPLEGLVVVPTTEPVPIRQSPRRNSRAWCSAPRPGS